MLALILSLIALGLVAFIIGWLRNRSLNKQLQRGEIEEMPHISKPRPDGCCGKHAVCEKEELAAALGQPIEYFDDEELDDSDIFCDFENDADGCDFENTTDNTNEADDGEEPAAE